MNTKNMQACLFHAVNPAKHEQEASFAENARIANVFIDFAGVKHGKIDERLICHAAHNVRIGVRPVCADIPLHKERLEIIMWLADKWNDYEVIDCSKGEKLERWGNYLLVRPDPQIIWDTPRTHRGWKHPNAWYHRSSKGGGEWEFFDLPEQWSIRFGHLTFQLKPFSFKHTGLFPEQAANWDWFAGLIRESGRPIRVLNLFAYTGGATLAAAAAGASVTHVDASKGMVNWAKENARSSGLEQAPIRWLVDDCVKFVEREIRRGNHYDGIIMDPPSYGRGPKGEIWKIEDAIHPLVRSCAQLLSDDPLFFLINSYTTGLAPSVLTYLLSLEVAGTRGGYVAADELGLPVTASRLVLPCGASGRWSAVSPAPPEPQTAPAAPVSYK